MHSVITTSDAPTPDDCSQGRAVNFGDFTLIYTSGQTANEVTIPGELVGSSRSSQQMYRACLNARAVLSAGSDGEFTRVHRGNIFIPKSASPSIFNSLEYEKEKASTILKGRLEFELVDCRFFTVDGIPPHNEPTVVPTIAAVNAIGVVGTIPPEYQEFVDLATRITPPLSSFRALTSGRMNGYEICLSTGATVVDEFPNDVQYALTQANAYDQTVVALRALRLPLEEIVAVNVALKDMASDWLGFSTAYQEAFTNTALLPVRTVIETKSMEPRVRISALTIGKDRYHS